MILEQVSSDRRNPGAKWFNSPVRFYKGKLPEMRAHLPAFERRGFALPQTGTERSNLNERLDTIVRLPFGDDPNHIPIGVVSKDYVLVPHMAVLDHAVNAIKSAKIPPEEVDARLMITAYGERMALSLFLPAEYHYDPGDGHPMALWLECLNSVDGSTRFRALMGWFRFVCSNGLVIGVTSSHIRRRHVGSLDIDNVGAILTAGLKDAVEDKRNFSRWRTTPVTPDQLATWVDKPLRKSWGFKAAARTFHIAHRGFDVKIAGPFKDNTPSTIPVTITKPVPGAPSQSRNRFDISQILAWLAQERRDVQEQLEWRDQIPGLMKSLK